MIDPSESSTNFYASNTAWCLSPSLINRDSISATSRNPVLGKTLWLWEHSHISRIIIIIIIIINLMVKKWSGMLLNIPVVQIFWIRAVCNRRNERIWYNNSILSNKPTVNTNWMGYKVTFSSIFHSPIQLTAICRFTIEFTLYQIFLLFFLLITLTSPLMSYPVAHPNCTEAGQWLICHSHSVMSDGSTYGILSFSGGNFS